MNSSLQIKSPDPLNTTDNIFAVDVIEGLTRTPKRLSSKYFYDDIGSLLFQKISQHPDYYLTRTELSILQNNSSVLPELLQKPHVDIIELGAGDGHKTQHILDGFLDIDRDVHFYPVDISQKAITLLHETIQAHADLNITGIVNEYDAGLDAIESSSDYDKLLIFLGSTIGNYAPHDQNAFLRNLREHMQQGEYLLIGFDLVKDVEVLTRAYNDSAGLTRQFNLNLLNRINHELGADFDSSLFTHTGRYNTEISAMESFLTANCTHQVSLLDREIVFDKGETIHMEYSYKFTEETIQSLCSETGFKLVKNLTDSKNYFIDSLWQAI